MIPYKPSRPASTNKPPKRRMRVVPTKGVFGANAQAAPYIPMASDIGDVIASWKTLRRKL